MKQQTSLGRDTTAWYSAIDWRTLGRMALVSAIVIPGLALADNNGDATTTTCGFLEGVQTLLNAISIVVVTIAIIFSGYQIAFAHKRIGEVAPVFIGAVLIGAASQIANLFLKNSAGTNACTATNAMAAPLTQFASLTHSLAGYLT